MVLHDIISNKSFGLKIKDGFAPDVKYGFRYIPLKNGNYSVIDRGSECDAYSCRVRTYGDKYYVDHLIEFLEGLRTTGFKCTMHEINPGERIFGENIRYDDPIDVAIINIGDVVHKTLKGSAVDLTLSAEGPSMSFVGTGHLPVLKCLQSTYKANMNWNFKVHATYYHNHVYTDHMYDTGTFESTFLMTKQELLELREFIRVNRGAPFTLDSTKVKGIDKIFGKRGKELPVSVRALNIKEKFFDVNHFLVDIVFKENKV